MIVFDGTEFSSALYRMYPVVESPMYQIEEERKRQSVESQIGQFPNDEKLLSFINDEALAFIIWPSLTRENIIIGNQSN